MIKRGVSFYSFQSEYFLRKLSLEDLIAVSQKMDIPGIEIIGDQMIPNYPNIPNEFIKKWHGWMDKYERTPVCLDIFLDTNKFKGRKMTGDEMFESVKLDILNANKLGCTLIRMVKDLPLEYFEKIAPIAEKNNVKLAVEVHAPSNLDSPLEQQLIELYERLKSPALGFTIDMGIYVKRLPRAIMDRFVRDGMKQSIADYLIEGYEAGTLPSGGPLTEKVLQMGGRQDDVYFAHLGTRMVFSNPRRMLDYMPYIVHCHGKFWEMLPDYTEYSIPFAEVIPVLVEGGYNGYIDSEYEGFDWIADAYEVDGVEQVRRQQVMLKRLLGDV
jgi:sugar phosphate isomerase/epimerase